MKTIILFMTLLLISLGNINAQNEVLTLDQLIKNVKLSQEKDSFVITCCKRDVTTFKNANLGASDGQVYTKTLWIETEQYGICCISNFFVTGNCSIFCKEITVGDKKTNKILTVIIPPGNTESFFDDLIQKTPSIPYRQTTIFLKASSQKESCMR